jgi:hypothetical protein
VASTGSNTEGTIKAECNFVQVMVGRSGVRKILCHVHLSNRLQRQREGTVVIFCSELPMEFPYINFCYCHVIEVTIHGALDW